MSDSLDKALERANGSAIDFLANALRIVFNHGVVSDAAFIRIVPPKTLAESLLDFPQEQAAILEATADITPKLGGTLGPMSVEDILVNALRTNVTEPETIRATVRFETWPLIVSRFLLWKVVEDDSWSNAISAGMGQAQDAHARQSNALIAILDTIDALDLLTKHEKLAQLNVDRLITDLPQPLKDECLRTALQYGFMDKSPFKPENLFGIVGNADLVRYVNASYLWKQLVLFVAKRLDLVRDVSELAVPTPSTLDRAAEAIAPEVVIPGTPGVPEDVVNDPVVETGYADLTGGNSGWTNVPPPTPTDIPEATQDPEQPVTRTLIPQH